MGITLKGRRGEEEKDLVSFLLLPLTPLLLLLAYPPLNQGYLAWIAFLPFFYGMERTRRPFLYPYLAGIIFYLPHLAWLSLVTRLGYVSLSVYLSLYFLLFGILVRKRTLLYLAPSLWIILEWVRGRVFSGFPWSNLALTQYLYPGLLKVLPFTGWSGLSFEIMWVNLFLYLFLRYRKAKYLIFSLLPLLSFSLPSRYQEGGILKLKVVQPSLLPSIKWGKRERLLPLYQELAGREREKLIIFPESILPFPLKNTPEGKEWIDWIKKEKLSIVFGSFLEEEGRMFNAVFFWDKGEEKGVYRKRKLVPFGEYLPLRRFFPFLEKILPPIGDFTPGEKAVSFTYREISFSPLICFENLFPSLFRNLKDSRLIIVLTDDAWFGRVWGPWQHFAHSVIRAAETGKTLLQVANTGITGWIDGKGRIRKIFRIEGKTWVRGTSTWEITLSSTPPTPYMKWGDWFIYLNILSLLLFTLGKRKRV